MEIAEMLPTDATPLEETPEFYVEVKATGEEHFLEKSIISFAKRFDQKDEDLKTLIDDFQILIVNNIMVPDAKKSIRYKRQEPTQRRIGKYLDKKIKHFIHNKKPYLGNKGVNFEISLN